MKTIAIDMDDVLADTSTPILAHYNEIKGINLTDSDFDTYNFYESLKENEKELIYSRIGKPGFFRNLEPISGAKEALKQLADQYEIYIVSAATQFPTSLLEKMEWLAEHFPAISWKNVVLCGSKSIIDTHYMIDDHGYNLDTFKGEGLLFDALHNRHETKYNRYKNWSDITDYLLK